MALLTYTNLEQISPLFKGKSGHILANCLMKLFAVDKVCELYDNNEEYLGVDFAHHILQDIGVNYTVIGSEILEELPKGAFITISNHPYGSIDGIMLIDLIGRYRPDFKVLVNQFLGYIKRLEPNFIKVVPTGKQKEGIKKESLRGIMQSLKHLQAGAPLGLFPSGAVSDLSIKDGCIRDREWQMSAIQLIKKSRVPVIPIRFRDRNSMFYYLLGLIDWRLRVTRLPREVFNKRNKTTRVEILPIITVEEQDKYSNIEEFRTFLRSTIYPIPK
mgnify:FL=1